MDVFFVNTSDGCASLTYCFRNEAGSEEEDDVTSPASGELPMPNSMPWQSYAFPFASNVAGNNRSSSTSTVTFKEKKGVLSFMNGLRNSVDFRDSNKQLEVSAPYEPVHVQHVSFDSITGKLTILPGKRQEFFPGQPQFQARPRAGFACYHRVLSWQRLRYDAL
jgi:hypothetical protein